MPRPRSSHSRRIPRQLSADDLPQWEQLLIEQHGVVDTEQLAAFGLTPDAIAAQVEADRWQPLLPRVYATTTGPPPRVARLQAALRYAGPAAVLSHRTAAEEWGMVPAQDGPVHVTVPYRCSAVSQPPHVIVHRSRAWEYIAVATVPPRTSRADTVLDLATAEPSAREAMHRLIGLVTTCGISLIDIERQLVERRPYRYQRALTAALHRMAGGVASVLEDLYALDVETAHGIPPAHRQAPFEVDGHTLWEDAVYDHVGVPLTVRLDGRAYHSNPLVAFRDRRRDNAAELAGRSRLVFGWRDIRERPCDAAREVLTVLHRHRWHGPTLRCHQCS
ncbi:MAG TPA: hypothetical protein VHH34_03085 [Pseudonocardiaceae bacterium]|nr:hypothetical protein [Pseudonocardiaceae bacterium]